MKTPNTIGSFPRAHPLMDLTQIFNTKDKNKTKLQEEKSQISLKDDVFGVHHVVDFRLCEWFNISYMQICAVSNLHLNLLNLLSGMTCGFLKFRIQVICKT